MTQEALATRSGVDARTVRNVERGNRVDAETLRRLASALGVNASGLARPSEQDGGEPAAGVIRGWEDAFFDADVDRLVACYRGDAVMLLPSSPAIEGSAAIRGAFEAAFEAYRFERLTRSVLNVVGAKVFLESGRVCMTSRADRTTTDAVAVHIFDVDNGMIIEHAGFYDTLQLVP